MMTFSDGSAVGLDFHHFVNKADCKSERGSGRIANPSYKLLVKGSGIYAIWARCVVEPKGGVFQGERYEEVCHYAVLVFTIGTKYAARVG